MDLNWSDLHLRLDSSDSCCGLSHISCVYCQHFLCSLLFVHIPILINCRQLHVIGVTVRPYTHLPKFERGANIFGPSNQIMFEPERIDSPWAGFYASCSCLNFGIVSARYCHIYWRHPQGNCLLQEVKRHHSCQCYALGGRHTTHTCSWFWSKAWFDRWWACHTRLYTVASKLQMFNS